MRKMIIFLSALLLATTASVAFAIEAPEAWVKAVAEGRTAPDFNEERIAKSVLGNKIKNFSPEQTLTFQREFRIYITNVYFNKFVNKYKNQPAVYNVLPANDKGVIAVNSVVGGLNANYTLENQSNAWKLHEVNVDGKSLVTYFRTPFSQEIEKNGIDGLIKMLKDTNSASGSTVAYTENSSANSTTKTAELPDDPQVLGASASPRAGKAKGKKKK